jgi:hypothetical protein
MAAMICFLNKIAGGILRRAVQAEVVQDAAVTVLSGRAGLISDRFQAFRHPGVSGLWRKELFPAGMAADVSIAEIEDVFAFHGAVDQTVGEFGNGADGPYFANRRMRKYPGQRRVAVTHEVSFSHNQRQHW